MVQLPYIPRPPRVISLDQDWPLIGDVLPVPLVLALFTAGLLVGARVSTHYARTRGIISVPDFRDQLIWGLGVGLLFALGVNVVLYTPNLQDQDLAPLLTGSRGLSSVGGFVGGIVGMLWASRRSREPVLAYADANVFGVIAGMGLCRLGCALVHDHPSRVVAPGTFMALGPWPCHSGSCGAAEIWRFDLGLLELLVFVGLAIFVYLIWDWRRAPTGSLAGLVALVYGLARLAIESLRPDTTELDFAGLDFAVIVALLFVAAGAWLVCTRARAPNKPKLEIGDASPCWRTP